MHTLDSLFLSCPACGAELIYSNLGEDVDTSCSGCGYKEKAGSQHIVEFISSVLQCYLAKKNIQTIIVGESEKINLTLGLVANGILPALVTRSNEYKIGNLLLKNVLEGCEILSLVRDDRGLFGKRVIYTGNANSVDAALFSVAQQLIPLSYTIDEAMLFTASRKNIPISKVTTLHINDIPTVNSAPQLNELASPHEASSVDSASEMSQ